MKDIWKEMLAAAFMGLILPAVLLSGVIALDMQDTQQVTDVTGGSEPLPAEPGVQSELTMRLRKADGSVQEMDMDAYLIGVVAAEMPASFEMEALKAQAVVARTYTLKAFTTGGKHGDGSVCTDYACCQAYREEVDGEDREKIASAVYSTSGLVLTYEGGLIEATYFSCSGGSTEDAVAVWGTDYPYLRATVSPGEEYAAHYTDTVYFTKSEFSEAFGGLTGDPEDWLGYATYTAGGGVNTMVIGGKEYRGTEIRTLLALRSTAFTMMPDADGVTVTTRGFGHRVGMSQYGADAMAAAGSGYVEILAYYYKGTDLTEWEEN